MPPLPCPSTIYFPLGNFMATCKYKTQTVPYLIYSGCLMIFRLYNSVKAIYIQQEPYFKFWILAFHRLDESCHPLSRCWAQVVRPCPS
jgi:hypothetical protein